jgi:hypothetical protein
MYIKLQNWASRQDDYEKLQLRHWPRGFVDEARLITDQFLRILLPIWDWI